MRVKSFKNKQYQSIEVDYNSETPVLKGDQAFVKARLKAHKKFPPGHKGATTSTNEIDKIIEDFENMN